NRGSAPAAGALHQAAGLRSSENQHRSAPSEWHYRSGSAEYGRGPQYSGQTDQRRGPEIRRARPYVDSAREPPRDRYRAGRDRSAARLVRPRYRAHHHGRHRSGGTGPGAGPPHHRVSSEGYETRIPRRRKNASRTQPPNEMT